MALVLIMPHLIHNKKEYGDFMYSANYHARFYRNLEFQGQPGFPSKEEVAMNAYAGEPVTAFEYIVQMHEWKDIVQRVLRGIGRVIFGTDTRLFMLGHDMLFFLYLLGLFMAIHKRWPVLLCLFLLNLTSYFLAGTREFNFDFRLTMHVIPLVSILIGIAIVDGLGKGTRLVEEQLEKRK
jgi:hypothetical protein